MISFGANSTSEKAIATLSASLFCSEMGFNLVILEGDAKVVVDAGR